MIKLKTIALKTIAGAGSALALALTVGAGAPAMAHHSGAMYDLTKDVTFRAVVKSFEWSNPHIRITVVGDPGGTESGKVWQIDSTSPGHLARDGWTSRSLKPGDHLEITMNPAKTGRLIGNLRVLTILETGRTLRRPAF